MGEHEKAVGAFQVLVRRYPAHFFGAYNLSSLLRQLNRSDEAIPYMLHAVKLRPNSLWVNVGAAYCLIRSGDGRARAEPYLRRARELLSPEDDRFFSTWAPWLQYFPVQELWMQGEVEKALSEVDRLAEAVNLRNGPAGQLGAGAVAYMYVTFGKLRTAEEIIRSLPDTPQRHGMLAGLAQIREDESTAREHWLRAAPSVDKVYFFAAVHDFPQAEKELRNAKAAGAPASQNFPVGNAVYNKIMPGILALARGQTADAVRLLEDGVGVLRHDPGSHYYFMGSSLLSLALERQGELRRALLVLAEAVQVGKDTYSNFLGAWWASGRWWLKLQWQRAQTSHSVLVYIRLHLIPVL